MSADPRGELTRERLRAVVNGYGLRGPVRFEPIARGASRLVKGRLRTASGDWMLKERSPEAMPPGHASFLHRFQAYLDAARVPLAPLAHTPQGAWSLDLGDALVELYRWMPGGRWERTDAEAKAAGAGLGRLLRVSPLFEAGPHAPSISFHRPGSLAGAARLVAEAARRADPDTDAASLRATVGRLIDRADRAFLRAEESGLSASPSMAVHGDLHPGNALFENGALSALLDFDAARIDRRASEVANALLHHGNDPIAGVDPGAWRVELDAARMRAYLAGVEGALGAPLMEEERRAIPWLMIEACTLESVVPVAKAGRFARLRADAFLPYVERKTAWIEAVAASLASP
jgi:homoserine kinase type II